MSDSPLIEQAKYQARLNGIDGALVCAVIEQESNWNTWAMRYEPAFFVKYVMPIAGLSDTEKHARSTSWGLMQTMGQVARERGCKLTFLSALCDPELGLPVGCEFLKHLMDTHEADISKALLAWNGGGNPQYPFEVIARMDKYR